MVFRRDGSHKFTHVDTEAVPERKRKGTIQPSVCVLSSKGFAGFILPRQKMMLWNWTPAAVLLDDVLMGLV